VGLFHQQVVIGVLLQGCLQADLENVLTAVGLTPEQGFHVGDSGADLVGQLAPLQLQHQLGALRANFRLNQIEKIVADEED
jgi:hypothetical protein